MEGLELICGATSSTLDMAVFSWNLHLPFFLNWSPYSDPLWDQELGVSLKWCLKIRRSVWYAKVGGDFERKQPCLVLDVVLRIDPRPSTIKTTIKKDLLRLKIKCVRPSPDILRISSTWSQSLVTTTSLALRIDHVDVYEYWGTFLTPTYRYLYLRSKCKRENPLETKRTINRLWPINKIERTRRNNSGIRTIVF